MLRAVTCASAALACAGAAAPQESGFNFQKYADVSQYTDGNKLTTGGSSWSGQADFQQYMQKYAGEDVDQGHEGGGSSKQGGFQQYVDQYAKDYANMASGGGSSSSNYQGYMSKYGDYSKFNAESGSQGVGGDAEQHTSEPAKEGGRKSATSLLAHGPGGVGLSGYMPRGERGVKSTTSDSDDYMKIATPDDYMKKYGSGGGDWQRYVPGSNGSSSGGGDWQKYISGSSGSSTGGFDYKKDMGGYNYSRWSKSQDQSFQKAPQDPSTNKTNSSSKSKTNSSSKAAELDEDASGQAIASGARIEVAPEPAGQAVVPESLASDAGARDLGSLRLVVVAACAAAIAAGAAVVEGVRSRRIVIETAGDPSDLRYSVLL